MEVKEMMTRHVETVRHEATLQEAAEKIRKRDIGPLPVCQDD